MALPVTKQPIRRALISVTDKSGIVDFAGGLAALGIEIVSTGGTATLLRDAGIAVVPIEQYTGFPEIMHGRVKTLHPKVHGGLLGLRDDPEHANAMKQHEILAIDLVCVNLYAFEKTIAAPGCTCGEAIENIDIGGPSMIRSAAKNHAYVTVVTDPADYSAVLAEINANQGASTLPTRERLAAKAFALTAKYDAGIASYLLKQESGGAYPPLLAIRADLIQELRYGENPHQSAALYSRPGEDSSFPTLTAARQLHGKELSYNNINDAVAALELVSALKVLEPSAAAACCVKHTNPCGAALAYGDGVSPCLAAIDEAIAGDPVAAFGGIIAVNVPVDAAAAERLCREDVFLEVLIAPSYAQVALDKLEARWKNLRILAVGEFPARPVAGGSNVEFRSIPGGLLVQDRDTRFSQPTDRKHSAGPPPEAALLNAAAFLEVVGKFLFSNAVVIGGSSPIRGDGVVRMFGGGAGQMDRVTSCTLAVAKAGGLARGAAAYSDAFFPFADGPTVLADAGVALIMHPGGSKRDQETFDLCAKRGVSCVLSGMRHFRH